MSKIEEEKDTKKKMLVALALLVVVCYGLKSAKEPVRRDFMYEGSP